MFQRAPGAAPALWLNILANYGGKLWSAFSIYAFVPLYIKLLGIEAYGVIAFQGALLGMIFIADAGLSSAFAREVAKSDDSARLRVIFRSLEVVYALITATVMIAIWLTHDLIAARWLNASAGIPVGILRSSVLMMGWSAALQMAMSLYFGGLMGAQRHPQANLYQIVFSILRSGLVLVPVYFVSDLRAFFLWQLLVAALFLAWLRRRVWQEFGGRQDERAQLRTLGPTWRFAGGMFGIAIISATNTQLDKLVVSKLLSLEQLARYSIMTLLAQVPSVITLPIAISILPRLTRLAEHSDEAAIAQLYGKYSFIIAALASIAGLSISAFSVQLLQLWAGASSLDAQAGQTVTVLTLGHVFLALQFMPYHLAIANGHNQTNIYIGAFFLLITPPALFYLVGAHGVFGAALPWLFMNAVAALLLGMILTKRFTRINLGRWWSKTVLFPVSACLAIYVVTLWAQTHLAMPHWIILAVISSAAMASACFALYSTHRGGWTNLPHTPSR